MHKHVKRLGLAFAISVTSLSGTLIWYYSGLKTRHGGEGKDAVARLTESTDEVQRKETTRVIWETVSLNDDLFTGEAIRTSAKASAKVRLKSGAVIHLDPDSLVVLEQNANGLSLDFLEGNLFIQSAPTAANGAPGITLKTGRGDIKVNGADVSLSRGQTGNVDLEVYRGELELNQGGKTVALGKDKAATLSQTGVAEHRDQLRLLAPIAGETILLNLGKGEKLPLGWTALPAGYRVTIEVGATRGALTQVGTADFDGVAGQAAIDLKPGRWFVRLTARAEGQPELTSLITPFTLAPRAAPALIEPIADAPVIKTSPDQPIAFHWLDRNPFDAHVVEIATDENFRKIVRRENLDGAADRASVALDDGAYFWRVTGFSNKKGLSSAVGRVRVAAAVDDRAALTAPVNHARVAAAEAGAKGVTFKWQTTSAKPLRLDVLNTAGAAVFHAESVDGFARATDLKAGVYRWSVTGGARASETFEFTIVDTPRLNFRGRQARVRVHHRRAVVGVGMDAGRRRDVPLPRGARGRRADRRTVDARAPNQIPRGGARRGRVQGGGRSHRRQERGAGRQRGPRDRSETASPAARAAVVEPGNQTQVRRPRRRDPRLGADRRRARVRAAIERRERTRVGENLRPRARRAQTTEARAVPGRSARRGRILARRGHHHHPTAGRAQRQ